MIYNGIDLTRVCPDSNDLMPHRKTVVGMVARFDTNKDHVTFISAALRLLAEGRDITFLVVGDGETLNTTKRLVPVDCAAIQFLGRRNDVDRLLSSFSIGVLSTFTEGISNAIMEYMARGKPVVASDVGGCREIVLDGVTGFLVPPRNPTALADRIAYLIDCPEVARRMGQAGRKRIVTHFSLETMVEKTVALYVRALRSSSRRTDDAAECCNATRRHERPF